MPVEVAVCASFLWAGFRRIGISYLRTSKIGFQPSLTRRLKKQVVGGRFYATPVGPQINGRLVVSGPTRLCSICRPPTNYPW